MKIKKFKDKLEKLGYEVIERGDYYQIKNSGKKVLVIEFEGMGYENNIDIFMGSAEAIAKAPLWDELDEQGERIYEDYAEYTDVLYELGLTYVSIVRHDLI